MEIRERDAELAAVEALIELPTTTGRSTRSTPWRPALQIRTDRRAAHGARRTIAVYSRCENAERAVDFLSDLKFPVERVAIVGTGLRSVEQILNRVTTARSAVSGAAHGAIAGVFITLLFGLFFTDPEFFGLLAYAVITGALIGGIFSAVLYGAQVGRRNFASSSETYAERYELQVDDEVADEAWELLDGTAVTRA